MGLRGHGRVREIGRLERWECWVERDERVGEMDGLGEGEEMGKRKSDNEKEWERESVCGTERVN